MMLTPFAFATVLTSDGCSRDDDDRFPPPSKTKKKVEIPFSFSSSVPIIPDFLYEIRHQNEANAAARAKDLYSTTTAAMGELAGQTTIQPPPSKSELSTLDYEDDDDDEGGTEAFVSQVGLRSKRAAQPTATYPDLACFFRAFQGLRSPTITTTRTTRAAAARMTTTGTKTSRRERPRARPRSWRSTARPLRRSGDTGSSRRRTSRSESCSPRRPWCSSSQTRSWGR